MTRGVAGLVTPGGEPQYPTFVNPIIASLGDSLVARGVVGASAGTTTVYTSNVGELVLAQAMNPCFRHDNWPAPTNAAPFNPTNTRWTDGANNAISGSDIYVHRDVLPYLLAKTPDIIFYRPTINSTAGGGSSSTTIPILTKIWDDIITAGSYLVAGTMVPWDIASSSFNGPENVANRNAINAAARAYGAALDPTKGMFIDYDAIFDPTATGYAISDLLSDKIHLSGKGALLSSAYINQQVIQKLCAPRNNVLDLWNNNQNLFPFPLLAGNTGQVIAPSTGQVATGLRFGSGGTRTSSCVLSLEPDPETGGQIQVITLYPAGASTDEYFQLAIGTAGAFTVESQINQYARGVAQVEMIGNDAWLVPQLYVNGTRAFHENANSARISDGISRTYFMMTDAGVMRTSSAASWILRFMPNTARAVSNGQPMVVKVRRPGYFIVPDPKMDYV